MSQNFEKTYLHYPFAELVGFGIAFVGMFKQSSEKKRTRAN